MEKIYIEVAIPLLIIAFILVILGFLIFIGDTKSFLGVKILCLGFVIVGFVNFFRLLLFF